MLERSTRVVERAGARREVVLEALTDARDAQRGRVHRVAARCANVQLRTAFSFRVHTPGGRELIPPTEMLLTRDMTYNEVDALAKEQEEAQLYREMQSDIVAQVHAAPVGHAPELSHAARADAAARRPARRRTSRAA